MNTSVVSGSSKPKPMMKKKRKKKSKIYLEQLFKIADIMIM